MNSDTKCYVSNGYDLSSLRSYKSDIREYAQRLYVRNGRAKGNIAYRDRFLVRDLYGGFWWYCKKSSVWCSTERLERYLFYKIVVILLHILLTYF